ncbi:DUF2169 domain-containing protein [Burkholderia stagnalis]|uniref:DUF2169 family type VI secretion system accessory protein n=1 Tax=Burkholderia stagnalis TaxID=1503054 RepID=UPI0007530B8B|nr:DUF2169 domain-containing protein [Burkholderia stagnalis]KVC55757.1 hypothetical protein WS59_28815 [Burkholderia stagnalis]KVN12906.1 hypothetical protein WT10_26980 [Burkholderia stagnalis]KWI69464.1 hypothetical protein WT75_18925 [Burkholderia stagnalis]KWK68948.1 hypothetical protein WT82_15195 [Burkholderia stagnalis]KWN25342.1 hypothetical protein WT84_04055 [Burkholderia stagnalis]
MKIIKPFRISPLTRLYRMHGEEHLGIAALMVATLGDAPQLLMDSELWNLVGDELGDYTLDMALPKTHPEFLVSGYAYGRYADAPGGGTGEVGIHIAGIEKRLRVFGERRRADSRVTAPAPFERLKLDWDLAYGGAGCADNPRGRGAETRDGGDRMLPNIEYAHSPTRYPDTHPVPAGYGPIDAGWPQRASLYGEHEPQWLEEDFPGFPRTLDPRYFNIAPTDQQWAELAELPDGAAYELTHLHPEHARLTGRLPALRARTFIVRAGSDAPEEIPMRLTTAWFMPHRERVVMIYHGATTVREFDASDVQTLLFGADASGHARPADWYRQVIEWRTAHEKAALYALRDQDLLPEGYLSADFPGMSAAASQEASQRILQNRLSVFPDTGEAQALPRPDQLVEYVERQEAKSQAERARLEKMREETANNEAFAAAARRGPPARIADPQDAGLGVPVPIERSGMQRMQRDADESLRELYLQAAHHQGAPARLSPAASRSHRERVAAAVAAGQGLEGVDLTGADLSGMQLRGARLAGAMLENADLSGADLTGAVLNRVVLARANLSRATFHTADLTGANLSLAECDRTDFSGANLSEGVVERVQLRECRLTGGVLDNTRFSACRFEACDFSRATLRGLIFIDQSFEDVDFSDATIRKMLLMNCSLVNVRFSSADIDGFGILDAQASGQLRFDRARVAKACFIRHCDIGGADFSLAMLRETNFREANLAGADFSGAHVTCCDFTDASLRRAHLRGAKVEESLFVRTDFTQADLRDIDLIAAFMRRATLEGADLRRANLFRANLAQILADHDTRWDEAYLDKAMRHPLTEQRT